MADASGTCALRVADMGRPASGRLSDKLGATLAFMSTPDSIRAEHAGYHSVGEWIEGPYSYAKWERRQFRRNFIAPRPLFQIKTSPPALSEPRSHPELSGAQAPRSDAGTAQTGR